MAPQFHSLTVKKVTKETEDAVSVDFDVPSSMKETYQFFPGQYLTLRTTIHGEDLRRPYSICSTPASGQLRVAIKLIDDGYFSTYANTELSQGHILDVMTPEGHFSLNEHSKKKNAHLAAIVAGSGITPVLSMAAHFLESNSTGIFHLFYGNRHSDTILFKDQLAMLADRYIGRFCVHHILSREEQEIAFLNGRIDEAKLSTIFSKILPVSIIDQLLLCGPAELIDVAEKIVNRFGLDKAKISREIFTPAPQNTSVQRVISSTSLENDEKAAGIVHAILDGRTRQIYLREGEKIIDASIRQGIDLPYSCKGGMCSTCRCKILEGKASMAINYSLEPWEIEDNFILSCQSTTESTKLVIDFDAV